MKKKMLVTLAFLITLTPAVSFAARPTGAHMRPQLFHDRAPHVHEHTVQAHH